MDQLVRQLVAFARDNEGASKEVYLALTALKNKDIELQKPENIEATGWKGLKKGITYLKSRLGRLIYKRDRMIQETKDRLSNLIKDNITDKVIHATEEEVHAFLKDLEDFGDDLDLETIYMSLESRLVAIHVAEVDELLKQSPTNFDAIETALAKLPKNNWFRKNKQIVLRILNENEFTKIEETKQPIRNLKMDQLVRRLLSFAYANKSVSNQVYLVLSALERKEIALKDPENIVTNASNGPKSLLGRSTHKRKQMIPESNDCSLKQIIAEMALQINEAEVQALMQDLQDCCKELDLEIIDRTLDDGLVINHAKALDTLFKQSPMDFAEIERALATLPPNNCFRICRQNDLITLKKRETTEFATIKEATDFLDKREWSDLSEFNEHSLLFDGVTTQAVCDALAPARERRKQEAAIYIQVSNLCNPSASTNRQEAQENLRAVEEFLAKRPGPITQAKLEAKRKECQDALAKFQAETSIGLL